MSKRTLPSWYHPADVRRTVTHAVSANIQTEKITTVLRDQEFDGLSETRVKSIIEAIPASEGKETNTGIRLSQSPSTDASARPSLANQCSVDDLEYLSTREAARVVGLALEQFDGNTVRPSQTQSVEPDLIWNRQYMTVAVKVIPASVTVGPDNIQGLVDGEVVPEDMRSPSEIIIATAGVFSEDAVELAGKNDIRLYDGGHVEEWLRRARIPQDAVGTVLEAGETHDGPLSDLVDIAPIPEPRKMDDPLEVDRAFDVSNEVTGTSGHPRSGSGTDPSTEDPKAGISPTGAESPSSSDPSSGQTETLYADPDEDGDYDAFDRFVGELSSETQSTDRTDQSSQNRDQPNNNTSQSSTDSDPTPNDEPIERKELLFDILDMKKQGGATLSRQDVQELATYQIDQYVAEFGSLAAALATVDIELEGDSQ